MKRCIERGHTPLEESEASKRPAQNGESSPSLALVVEGDDQAAHLVGLQRWAI